MAKNVMKMLKPKATHGRNGFDLSHRNVFSAEIGCLYPTLCLETVPKDHFEIRVADLLRAQPLAAPTFARMKQHLELWFVPYNYMWHRFNEFMVDKDEPASSSFLYRDFLPSVSLRDMQNILLQPAGSSYPEIPKLHSQFDPRQNTKVILDLLGYAGTGLSLGDDSLQYPDVRVNLFRLAAYNYIWYHEYRQKYYDDGTFGYSTPPYVNKAAQLFNFDDLSCHDLQGSDPVGYDVNYGYLRLAAMMQPRYRLWKKDLFTGLMPAQQFGNVSVVNMDTVSNQLSSYTAGGTTIQNNLAAGSTGKLYYGKIDLTTGGLTTATATSLLGTTSFDILALRKSEAVQHWRENALRAGNQIEDNFEAHYGVKPNSHIRQHPIAIGAVSAPVNIGDVNVTASTEATVNNVAGDVAGKMISSFDGEKFVFDTNDFGVIIGMWSVLPEAEYNAIGVDRPNCLLEREDFFVQEYENLGLEAVSNINISAAAYVNVLGYAPRYWSYKTKIDKVNDQLMYFQGYEGILRQWTTPKWDIDLQTSDLDLSFFYVNPYLFGVNFAQGVQADIPQLIVDMYNKVDALRAMSVSGMPGY